MNTTHNPSGDIIPGAMFELLMKRRKFDDRLVLPDDLLEAAMDGRASLSPLQLDALLDSPLTLRRYAVLQAMRAERSLAANDEAFWQGSCILRRAADGGGARSRVDHLSENGHWQLSFQPMGQTGWLLSLTLLHPERAPAALSAGLQAVELVDGCGKVWCSGPLDPDADEGPGIDMAWEGEGTPEQRFMASGARFDVRPC